MDTKKIRACLRSSIKVITVKETTSTNDQLKKLALCGEKETVLYIAEAQSAGKGTKGRSFFSPKDTGIYMSLLIHPDFSTETCTLITPMCAVAVAEAIENVVGIRADIKWVNDIYIAGRKVAGILTEGSFSEKGADYLIVGIGINLNPPEGGFPEEIKNIAGALTESSHTDRELLIAETVNRFMLYYREITKKSFLPLYKSRMFFLGKEITVMSPSEEYRATAVDIDVMCRLIVETEGGERKVLGSGEISIKN